jgi:hypothetical protein
VRQSPRPCYNPGGRAATSAAGTAICIFIVLAIDAFIYEGIYPLAHNNIDRLLKDIRSHWLPGTELASDSIYPNYHGQSILNIPSSICQLLNIPLLETDPLHADMLTPLGYDRSTVLVILMDALAFHRLRAWMEEDRSLVWNRLAADGTFAPITSVVPSTTSVALPTLWTGASPARLGLAGYEMWLQDYGLVANMIQHIPSAYHGNGGGLEQAGFTPETFLPAESLATHLTRHGVTTHVFQNYDIIKSGMSRMFFAEAELHPISGQADLWASVRALMTERPDERKYIWVYWSGVDGLSHLYGPDDERIRWEFKLFSDAFEGLFLDQLPAEARQRASMILTADHGQITTDKQAIQYTLPGQHPEFLEMLHMKPTGENRLAYLYVRPGCESDVRTYIDRHWPDQFQVLDSAAALASGLFGPGEPHSQMDSRIGELIVAARGDAYWWWSNPHNPLVGRHGGLSEQEMIVPFLGAQL